MRCLAWLHAVPKKVGKSGGDKNQSRMQGYLDSNTQLPLSPAGCAAYLVDYLFAVGPVSYSAMGAMPLLWQELTHWQRNAGIDLTPWEAITLRQLSADYVAESHAAESPTRPAPWLPDDRTSAETRNNIAKKIRSILRS